jgi:hypothetical protein
MANPGEPRRVEGLVDPADEHERERTQWTGLLALGGVWVVVATGVAIILAVVLVVYVLAGR